MGLDQPQFEAAASQVAAHAAALIVPGMRLGLGSGRMASAFVEALRPRIQSGLRIQALCSSRATEVQARAAGLEILTSSQLPLDLDVDGADEYDRALNLLKGGGGALLREKVVAGRSRRFWVVADPTKQVGRLGTGRPLPVEVLTFDWEGTAALCQEQLQCRCELRGGKADPVITDNGNYLLDLHFSSGVIELEEVARRLDRIAGVLGHGLFVGMATAALVSDGHGVRVLGSLDAQRTL